MPRILIVTPRFPIPATGACEQDRLEGIKQFARLGHDVHVVSKFFDFQDSAVIQELSKQMGIPVVLIPYRKPPRSFFKRTIELLKRFTTLSGYDGAAYEYADPVLQEAVARLMDDWKPDILWCDYTYLWPAYRLAKKRNIPIITRSINFEPRHFLQEDGVSFVNFIKYVPKYFSEFITARSSAVLLAITPKEEKTYTRMGARCVRTLPLRNMPTFLGTHKQVQERSPLHVFFMGSTYSVSHNLETAKFLLFKVIPQVNQTFSGQFIFHIFGSKLPQGLINLCVDNIIHEGYVPEEQKEVVLASMDIALSPSLFGAGMQQKIFEPLARGIPTITSGRGVAGYPFTNNREILFADSPEEYVQALGRLTNVATRKRLSEQAVSTSRRLFSEEQIDFVIQEVVRIVLAKQ